MAVVLSLLSAFAYGVSDFLGGIFSKRAGPWQVAVVGQTSSAVCISLVAVVVGGSPSASDWWWGALAGLGSGVGTAFLYRGLAGSRMGVVAPLSAVTCALLPVVVGLATGERPSPVVATGIALAFPAILLISRMVDGDLSHRGGVIDGTLAGLGFGMLFAAVGQIDSDAGLLPLILTQTGSILSVVLTAVVLRQAWVPRRPEAWRAVVMGPLGALATGSFLVATSQGLLSVVAVISSLYPAVTVVLATMLLKERIHGAQAVGLALAAAAVSLVALG